MTSLLSMNNLTDGTKESIKYLWLYGNQISGLDGLEDFTSLIYLNIYGNNLNNINTLKNMSKLEYLRLADNTFADADEKQNTESDSLYSLQNLKNLYWLDISANSGIKYISYLILPEFFSFSFLFIQYLV